MTTETRKRTLEKKQDLEDYNICSFCDYGPYGYSDCPKPYIQRERIKEGFCGFADIDGCQVRITKEDIIVHNVYNPNIQKTNGLEDVKIPLKNILDIKNTLNSVPEQHRKKEFPTPSVLSKVFDSLEANV
ncbi:hypothetical protein GF378_02680 [Candidatus Pacearchaeota archaeon]|nr:hypothetical protein [Candidatus Pacearchaeota archaeon]